jgi:hypothetical protein
MMINQLFKKALVLGASIIAVGVVARATYDPAVELFPGRTIPLTLQLLSLRTSESMDNDDSNVVGAGRVG